MSSSYGIAPSGYRLPDATRLGRVRLQVADLERSIVYYETVIGLRVLERSGSVATLGAHGSDAPVVELHEKAGVRPVSRRGHIGLYHFAILLPDRAALGRFVRHLGEIGAYAGMSDHFVSEAVYLQDPDGLGIEVYADRPRSEWRVEDRQLAMTTIPLNVPDLVAAGGDAPWTGAPAGTTIGHVHLHVRDIDEAAAFYHEALGLDKVVWSYPGALFMSAGGYHHHLGTNTWAAGAPLSTDDDARLLEWEILVPDVESIAGAVRSLQAGGFDVEADGSAAVVRDPWGTQVRVLASR
ncbi:MAG: Glyoxalase/bleomycin resistance protein/dioxygenase [Gemmatimonadetes bacterium]|nr:Glyoxalase/bleomycin resistance protein/dioxygenase [Gemmatimonadota bacterium]